MTDFRFELDDRGLQRALSRSPRTLARHLGSGIATVVGSTRNPDSWRFSLVRDLPPQFRWVPRAFRPRVKRSSDIDRVEGRLRSASPAVEGLEFGGVRRPRRGQRIAIPIGKALTSRGRVRKKYRARRDRSGNTRSIRDLGLDLVAVKQPNGTVILFEKSAGSGRRKKFATGTFSRRGSSRGGDLLEPVFVLLRSVRQKALLDLRGRWKRYAPQAARVVNRSIGNALEEMVRRGR